MKDFLNVFEFLFLTPFTQNWVFPILIIIVGVSNFFYSLYNNHKRFNNYNKNMNNLIFDDYKNAKSSGKVPGILMSIGIIGTFFLIYESLGGLNENTDMMTLISLHIAPAFSISAIGIVASIIYVTIEKFFIIGSYKTRIKLLENQHKDRIQTYNSIANEQTQISKEILEATKKQTKIFKSLSSFSDGLNDMSKSMGKFGEIATTLEKTLNPEVLGNVISTALLKDLNPVLADIKSITSNVDNNSQKITKFLEEDLKNEIMIPLKKSVDNTKTSMQEMKEVLEKTSDVMNKTSQGIEKIADNLNKLEESQTKFVKNLDDVLDKQKDEFEKTTETITTTYKKLTDDILRQTEGFEENSKIILNSFTDLSQNMTNFLNDYKADYRVILDEQKVAIKETSDESIKLLTT